MWTAHYASPPAENSDLTAENNAFFKIDFDIIETLYIYIPVTIVNTDHAAEASTVGKSILHLPT
jgi:hypothetical protein